MKNILTIILIFIVSVVFSQNLHHTYTEKNHYVVTIEGKQPTDNTDWDLVHGVLGSKRLTDDLEERVSKQLSQMFGNWNVKDIKIESYKQGNYIYTKAKVYIGRSDDNKSYTVFTTRGSIGYDYVRRHDEQVFGLTERLSTYYGNGTVKTFGPYVICVSDENGECFMKYKQSFYTVSVGK